MSLEYHAPSGQGPTSGQADRDPARRSHTGKRPKKIFNPLQRGIQDFVTNHLSPSTLSNYGLSPETLSSSLPKRFTAYEPLLLLPANAFSIPAPWGSLYQDLDAQQRHQLYESLAAAFSHMGVTHIAINAPIAPTDTQGHENRMRSPVGLIPLHGDFGPPPSGDGEEAQPSELDFQHALWVRTVQNHGIVQIWAPLYTMFSRGNITEKARILGAFEGLDEGSLAGQEVGDVAVVDMYAGIGYFVFSYLKKGVRRVWGWEINGWSVEGLRRGCVENGWGCRVVAVRDGALNVSVQELVESLDDQTRVVIFHGDNKHAARILSDVQRATEATRPGEWNSIRHVNLGLLPTSRAAWDNACSMVDAQRGGWLHVHENIDIQEVEQKKQEFTTELQRIRSQAINSPAIAECRHVEFVKTYAPGVMHCVFDVRLSSPSDNGPK
ncbi:hypothetical protein P168DRAFT_270034 [Aspergillus campestris IBT 28561]|uniref:tRNA wybutosine-synthesizing protein 2 n=1 Tax=Aspergillus campestris (strain IBT 28561) TaxID=1392248 RepID=A0A2I1D186_ASPC2|nr:uncharacterized protein P168DRAFT_270034 [Aspergillus campestris IBT 28561]PKY03637.1 hypothetical protein P168DRAFT_270034 [Aspergillus campestris IBT 28561]